MLLRFYTHALQRFWQSDAMEAIKFNSFLCLFFSLAIHEQNSGSETIEIEDGVNKRWCKTRGLQKKVNEVSKRLARFEEFSTVLKKL